DKAWSVCGDSCPTESQPARVAAHLWAGVGGKKNRETAIVLWEAKCKSASMETRSCVAYALAIRADDVAKARSVLAAACRASNDALACAVGSHWWTRVDETLLDVKLSIELPAVMHHLQPWGDALHADWHVPWSTSWDSPDVDVELHDGKLACTAHPPR